MAYPYNGGFRNNEGFGNNERNPSPPPFPSTPIIPRSRPRFANSGPPNYPRPGSSATRPNPSSFSDLMRSRYNPSDQMSDSMMNNCGDSMQYMEGSFQNDKASFASEYNSSVDSFQSQNSSLYYSCNESFGAASPRGKFPRSDFHSPHRAPMNRPLQPPPFLMDGQSHFEPAQQKPWNRQRNFQSTPKNKFKAASSVINAQEKKPTPYFKKPKLPFPKSEWRCEVCDIDFTSRHPFTMHFQGAKHAKKLKLQESLQVIQSQVTGKEIVKVGSTFHCDLCGVLANSAFQLQTHLEGVKHKSKLVKMEEEEESKAPTEAEEKGVPNTKDGKANGAKKSEAPKERRATISVLPTVDVPAPKPVPIAPPLPSPAFICTLCNVNLNSRHQYEQHMVGKYHKAKASGTALPYKKKFDRKMVFVKSGEQQNPASEVNTVETTKVPPNVIKPVVGILKKKVSKDPASAKQDSESTGAAQTVVGVKTLERSFVARETLK